MKKLLSVLTLAAMLFAMTAICLCNVSAADPLVWDGKELAKEFGGGDGSEASPYLIKNAAQLNLFCDKNMMGDDTYEGKFIRLDADINWGGNEWTPVGNSATAAFKGTFDGNGKTIYNLTCSSTLAGIFAYATGATIKDLAVDYATFKTTTRYAGTFVGLLRGGSLSGCVSGENVLVTTGSALMSTHQMGGIVGLANDEATVTYCVNNAKVLAVSSSGDTGFQGGIVGVIGVNAYVSYCINNGAVDSTLENFTCYVGGILGGIGSGSKPGKLTNCYNAGAVTSKNSYAGGIVGRVHVADSEMANCYNLATVTGPADRAGTIIGLANKAVTVSELYSVASGAIPVSGLVAEGVTVDAAALHASGDTVIKTDPNYIDIDMKLQLNLKDFAVISMDPVETTVPTETTATPVETTKEPTVTTASPVITTKAEEQTTAKVAEDTTVMAEDTTAKEAGEKGCGKSGMLIYAMMLLCGVATVTLVKKK